MLIINLLPVPSVEAFPTLISLSILRKISINHNLFVVGIFLFSLCEESTLCVAREVLREILEILKSSLQMLEIKNDHCFPESLKAIFKNFWLCYKQEFYYYILAVRVVKN